MSPAARTAAGRHVRPRSTARRVVAGAAAAVVGVTVVGGAAGAAVVSRLGSNITSVDVDAQLGGDRPVDEAAGDTTYEPLQILVMGSDDRSGLRDSGSFGGDIGGGGSDTTLLVHVAGDRKSAVAVSIPRDSMVEVPGCARGNPDGEPRTAMFNSALAGGGPACAIQTVEDNTGIRIDHFAVVDFDGFQDMVDALGGVDVCLPEAVQDEKSHLDLPAGISRVSGDQALAYVRARYNFAGSDGSDVSRIGRQQQFLSSMVQEVTSAGILLRPDRLFRFLDAATSSLTTDPGLASIGDLTGLAQSMSSLRPDDVSFVTVPFEEYAPDPNRLQWAPAAADLWAAIRTDSPLPGSEPEPEPTPAATPEPLTVSPADVVVDVLNGTGLGGKAGEAAEDLALQGFGIGALGNAEAGAFDGVRVTYPTGAEAAAETVAAAFPGANVVEDPSLTGTLVVTLGTGAPAVVEVPNRLGDQPLPDRAEAEPTAAATIEARSGAEDICAAS
ncbi:LCP family protein [Pseudokineococcus lusitanus]|uniref:LytR family transcriptional attenuator n=1 Tax=Pseudokineococcus lusitanus TaxID=763993 RepID=A0A3N1HQR8_9ACTN|nr:LCP family protein [Pseudokineococcus lusitanus]ROP44732.1 LytR family transcriptional attenuator [Pseudokineococcus lusitanus]